MICKMTKEGDILFVLNEENKKRFQAERKELEGLDITSEEYQKIQKTAIEKIIKVYDILDYDVRSICEQNPFLIKTIGNVLISGLSNLDYAYGLLTGIKNPDDDPEEYQKDREDLLLTLRQEILHKDKIKG